MGPAAFSVSTCVQQTVISLGTRVALAYLTAPVVGVIGIWWAVPIGWILADLAGAGFYLWKRRKLLCWEK